jgi:hypothetical protein
MATEANGIIYQERPSPTTPVRPTMIIPRYHQSFEFAAKLRRVGDILMVGRTYMANVAGTQRFGLGHR